MKDDYDKLRESVDNLIGKIYELLDSENDSDAILDAISDQVESFEEWLNSD